MEPVFRQLGEHPFLKGLSEEELRRVQCSAREASFPAGALIFREGEEADALYLLRGGRVALELQVPGKGTQRVEMLKGGDILGLSWLFPPYRWQFDARAVEPVEALVLEAACLRGPSPEAPVLEPALALRLVRKLYERLERVRLQRLDVYKEGA